MKTSRRPNTRSIRNFFIKEPKFSVPIALVSMAILFFFYFCSRSGSTFTLQEKQEAAWIAQKELEQATPACEVEHIMIIWRQTWFLPTN